MIKKVLLMMIPLQLLFSSGSTPFQEVEDLSDLPLLSPDFAKRESLKLRLANGLELLLISDPNADESGASVSVEVGSWSDPKEFEGMAHFCEHMLFMGTQKYPAENEFFSLLSNYAGTANAFTAPHRTVYMFASQEEGFLPLLDRFGHFFIDPLFNPDNIAREMHAVDQEFAKNIENDGWRSYMVWKETGNPDHPNKGFSCGNSQTLSKIPQEALKKWHQEHYGAEKMHVAIYSSLPLSQLKESSVALFNAVPKSCCSCSDCDLPLSSELQKGSIIYIQPVQDRRFLTLSWELPPSLAHEKSHAAELIAYALNRGQKQSLYEVLKKEQLIDTMKVKVEDAGGKEHRFFQFQFELTEKGIQKIDRVGLFVFEALAALQSSGLPTYLFEEKNQVVQLGYQYQSRKDGFSTVAKLGESLADEPLESFPRSQLLAADYDAEKIRIVLSILTPKTCSITLLAPFEKTKMVPEKKERWLGADYAIQPIPKEWLACWSNPKPNSAIRIAEPNPFLPKQLHLVSEKRTDKVPSLLASNEMGTAYYARCPEYETPETSIHLHLLSPLLNTSAKSQVLTSLYLDHLTDQLGPTLSAAASANLHATFKLERCRIHLHLFGFSEKAPQLLREILKEIPLSPPTEEQFAIYADRHAKMYANIEKELPFTQGREKLNALLDKEKITSRDKLAALQAIRHEDLLSFHKQLFETSYTEALFAGNLTVKEAQSAWLDTISALGKTPYPKEAHPKAKILKLPEREGPFALAHETAAQGNAAFLTIGEGSFSFDKRAAQEILAMALKEAFFNELRTKQKTGYIVASQCIELEGELFQIFLVQSNSHEPEDLLYRFELFLEEYLHNFSENISMERFETLKRNAAASLKTRFRNLKDKSTLWDTLCFEKRADFSFIDKRVAAIENLPYEALKAHAQQFLSRTNRKRLALFIKGHLSSPFVYEVMTQPKLDEIARY